MLFCSFKEKEKRICEKGGRRREERLLQGEEKEDEETQTLRDRLTDCLETSNAQEEFDRDVIYVKGHNISFFTKP